jgi:hypothetical protein
MQGFTGPTYGKRVFVMNELLTDYAHRMLQFDEPCVVLFLRNGNTYTKSTTSPSFMLRTVPPMESIEIVGIFGHALVATPIGDGTMTESDWVSYATVVTRDAAVTVALSSDGVVTQDDNTGLVDVARNLIAVV